MYSIRVPSILLLFVFVVSTAAKLDWKAELGGVKSTRITSLLSTSKTVKTKLIRSASIKTVQGMYSFENDMVMVIVEDTASLFYSFRVDNASTTNCVVHDSDGIYITRTLSNAELKAEMYVLVYHSALPPQQLRTEVTSKLVQIKAVEKFWEVDSKSRTFVALICYMDEMVGFVAFTYGKPCSDGNIDKKETDVIIIVGYSQKVTSKVYATAGVFAYLCHPQAFGEIPYLASYFSGYEADVRTDMWKDLSKIKNEMTRRMPLDKDPNVTIALLRTFFLLESKKCIGVLTYMISQRGNTYKTYYFFVVYDATLSKSIVTLGDELIISVLTNTEFSCMMNLIDYLKPNHISEQISPFNIEKLEEVSNITTLNEKNDDAVKLMYAADFAARKHTLRNRETGKQETADKMPYINHSFVVARAVMERCSKLSWSVYAAIFLKDTLPRISTTNSNCTQEEFNTFFGSNNTIMELVNQVVSLNTATLTTVPNGNSFDSNFLKKYDTPNFAPGELIEGNTNPETVLYSLVKERIRKKYVVKLKQKDTRPFEMAFAWCYWRGDTLHGIYNLNVEELIKDVPNKTEIKTYYFDLKVSTPHATRRTVVGEMYADLKTITDFENIDIETAKIWLNKIGPKYQNSLPNTDVCKIVKCLEYASRKHFNYFQRRKDSNDTPYINHPIGVAMILIKVGGVFEIDLILAALLHDTLENTSATFEELEANFNHKVASIVLEVSDDLNTDKDGGLTAGDKKKAQNDKAKKQSLFAVLVKLADRIHNLLDFGRQRQLTYEENKRRWQFSNAEILRKSYIENRDTNRKTEWELPINDVFEKAYQKLNQKLADIITEFNEIFLKTAIF